MGSAKLNVKQISALTSLYFKLCIAGVKEDMAKRIMFSILPSLSSPLQTATTGGVVDVNALKTAVEGRKDIIKYGVKAVTYELTYYNAKGKPMYDLKIKDFVPYEKVSSLLRKAETTDNDTEASTLKEEAMTIAVDAFSDPDAWEKSFGGKPWEQIARTLRNLVRLDRTLNEIRKRPRTADTEETEIGLMKQIIVELNVFDGLSHNTASILKNVINLESADRNRDSETEFRNITKLMDAKELDSPTDVYQMIEPTLRDSGDIHRFKDWVSLLRGRQEHFQESPRKIEKLFMIRLRKRLISMREYLNDSRDEISNMIKSLEQDFQPREWTSLRTRIANVKYYLSNVKEEIRYLKESFILNNTAIMTQEARTFVEKYENIIISKATSTIMEIDPIEYKWRHVSLNSSNPTTAKALEDMKAALTSINGMSYFLDSI